MVVAVLDGADAHFEQSTDAIVALRGTNSTLKVSAVSIAELRSDSRPGRELRLKNLAAFIDALGPDPVVPLDRITAERAGEIRAARRSIGLADAMIKATAESIGAQTLLTTDRALARMDGTTYVGVGRS